MTYYPDLTEYEYIEKNDEYSCVNIGWLSAEKHFDKGVLPFSIIEKIEQFSQYMINVTRGFHDCELFSDKDVRLYDLADKSILLGSAEVRIFSNEPIIYAAPNLLIHYVTEHGYLPPKKFIDAIQNGPLPDSQEYRDLLSKHNIDWVSAKHCPKLPKKFRLKDLDSINCGSDVIE